MSHHLVPPLVDQIDESGGDPRRPHGSDRAAEQISQLVSEGVGAVIAAPTPGQKMDAVHLDPTQGAVRHELPDGMEMAVELREVSVFYGSFQAVDRISLDVPRNRVTALIGPSGCGKSTLLRCLNRMNDLIPGGAGGGRDSVRGAEFAESDGGRGGCAASDRDGVSEAQPVSQVDL